jgi:Protein of unknown function (DUF2934)
VPVRAERLTLLEIKRSRLRPRLRDAQSARSAASHARKEELMATRRLPDASKPAQPATETAREARARKSAAAAPARTKLTPAARHALIAQSAYLRAERRGFAPGQEMEDWLAAEAEVEALLRVEHGGSPQ